MFFRGQLFSKSMNHGIHGNHGREGDRMVFAFVEPSGPNAVRAWGCSLRTGAHSGKAPICPIQSIVPIHVNFCLMPSSREIPYYYPSTSRFLARKFAASPGPYSPGWSVSRFQRFVLVAAFAYPALTGRANKCRAFSAPNGEQGLSTCYAHLFPRPYSDS